MSTSMTLGIREMEYEALDREIKRTMRRSAKDAVQLGFMLRQMMEKKMWEAAFDCFDAYLEKELRIDYSMANRFMNINRKYSVSGNSMEISAEYEEYSQGLLIEMLNMPPELEAKVTPDMTVKQVREIKKQAKAEKEAAVQPVMEKKETIIDGEYREIEEPEPKEENIATSQPDEEGCQKEKLSPYGLSKTIYPEGSLLTTVGCGNKYDCFSCAQDCTIRQEDRYCVEAPMGNPFNCTTMGVLKNLKTEIGDRCQFVDSSLAYHTSGNNKAEPCCKECQESCGYRCQRSQQPQNPETEDSDAESEEEYIPEDDLPVVKRVLKQEKKILDDYLEVGGLPEMTVLRQKIIVGALSSMVRNLEDMELESDPEEITQMELPVLKNNDQRKEWLAGYKAWGLWYRDENIDVNYYKYDFEDGSRLVVAEYPQRYEYWNDKRSDDYYFHLLEKNKKSYKKTYDEQYRNSTDSETYLVDFLKKLQKKG
ncbi:MAG: hypothetical protein HDR24_00305 [Lachnospiraceae bacterium]|nr:hypothetical protein [Lachnospiraceae bacterium]